MPCVKLASAIRMNRRPGHRALPLVIRATSLLAIMLISACAGRTRPHLDSATERSIVRDSAIAVPGPDVAPAVAPDSAESMVTAAVHSTAAMLLPRMDAVPAPDSAPPPGSCFRGRPLPRCRSFWITEASYSWRVGGSSFNYSDVFVLPRLQDLDGHFSWDVGYMKNVDPRQAFGGTVMAGTGDAGIRLAAKGRYRLWLDDRQNSVDVSLGVLTAGVRSPRFSTTERGVGITGDVTLGFGDYVGVTAKVEAVRTRQRTAAALFGGVRLGSYPAIAASAIGAVGLLLLIAAISRTNF